MFTIYEIIGFKIGCTIQKLEKRFKSNIAYYKKKGIDISGMKCVALEYHTNIEDATRRERELKVEKGYGDDGDDYKRAYNNIKKFSHLALTKEKRRQAVKNTDFKKRSELNYHAKAQSHRQRAVNAIRVSDGSVTRYSGIGEASRQLSKILNKNYSPGYVQNILKGRNKTTHGYTFEYA